MQKVLIVKNIQREGPGLVLPLLLERRIPYEIVEAGNGNRIPDPRKYSAMMVLGGPASANDTSRRMKNELGAVRAALGAGVPYFGICLGMQVLVKAAGGEVVRSEVQEIGWRDDAGRLFEITLTAKGKRDPLFAGVESPMRIFHLHGETVTLTPEMALLATGRTCTVQVVRIGENAYGLQGHLEVTPEMLEVWVREDSDLRVRPEKATHDWGVNGFFTTLEAQRKRVFENFLERAGLVR